MTAKILLVDDEEMIVESIEYALLQEGSEVVRASNGQEALQQIQRPREIVLDRLPRRLEVDPLDLGDLVVRRQHAELHRRLLCRRSPALKAARSSVRVT